MKDQIERFLRIEELYQNLMGVVYGPPHTQDINPDDICRALDPILAAGKIEGRLTAYNDGFGTYFARERDRLIEDWQRIVDLGGESS